MRRLHTFLGPGLLAAAIVFVAGTLDSSAYVRKVVVEEWTSATCPPCVNASRVMNRITDPDRNILSIRYHVPIPRAGDPFHTYDLARGDWGFMRERWYDNDGQNTAPYAVVDGVFGDLNGNDEPGLLDAIEQRLAIESPLLITVEEDRTNPTNPEVTVTVKSDVALTDHVLQVVVLARHVSIPDLPDRLGNISNGEDEFNDAMLDMLPNNEGTTFSIEAGEEKVFKLNYTPLVNDEKYPDKQIYVTSFVQNMQTKEILQVGTNLQDMRPAFSYEDGTNYTSIPRNSSTVKKVVVENTGPIENTYDLELGGLPDGWTANLSETVVTLAPGASQTLDVTVNYPNQQAAFASILVNGTPRNAEGPGAVLGSGSNTTFGVLSEDTKYVVWTGLSAFTPVYINFAVRPSAKYGIDAADIPASEDWLEAFGDDVEVHVLPVRYNNLNTVGQGFNFLTAPWVDFVEGLLEEGHRIAVFSQASLTWAFTADLPAEEIQPTKDFFNNTLGVDFVQNFTPRYSGNTIQQFPITGVTGDPIGNGINIQGNAGFAGQTWPVWDAYTDIMSIRNGSPSSPTFYLDNNEANVSGVRAEVGPNEGRIAYFGFGLPSIPREQLTVFVERTFDWLLGEGGSSDGPVIASINEVDFETVKVDEPLEKSFLLMNQGNEDLVITSIDIEGDDEGVFAREDLTFPLTIPADGNQRIHVTFTPKAADVLYEAFLAIASNATNEQTRFVDLIGRGDGTVSVLEGEAENQELALKSGANPFTGSTPISYTLKGETPEVLRLAVFNAAGQEVQLLHNGLVNPGTYSVELNGASLPAGAFYVVLQSASSSVVVPAVLVK